MLNGLWAGMIVLGVLWGAWNGTMGEVGAFALESAQSAVTLCVTMAGILALWSGLMEVAKEAGILNQMEKGMRPALHFLFPEIPKGHPALQQIAVNFTANILGLGWAATPAGLAAMRELRALEQERGNPNPEIASKEMCTFLILNISSLQLLPVNVIVYRTQYGSVDPAGVIGPGLAATFVSTAAAVLFCKWQSTRKQKSTKRNKKVSL